jgi:hypothetical protein
MKPLKYELESGYIAGLNVKYPVIRTDSGKVIGMCLDEESPYLHAFVAAPEMLEALEAIVATNPHNAPMTHEQIRSAYAESLRTARTAIAKAKGEQP